MFRQMYQGTLATKGPWQALVTFQQFIILSDREGTVDMTPEVISRETTIPLDIIKIGITALEQPDLESRSPDEEGRRIVRLAPERAWGWRVVNYKHYRALKREEDRREYHRRYWHQRKDKAPDSTTTQPTQPIAEAEAYTDATSPTPPQTGGGVRRARNAPSGAETLERGSIADAQVRWLRLLASKGAERDQRVQAAIDAIGGWPRIQQRTPHDQHFIRKEFCDAYLAQAAQPA